MKNYYLVIKTTFSNSLAMITLLLLLCCGSLYAQVGTPLAAGDLSIIGVSTNTSGEGIAFVIWKPIETGTEIRFMDNGFNAAGAVRWREQVAKWTAGSNLPAGTVITIADNATNTGTVSIVNCFSDLTASWSVLGSGDQVFAYQGKNMPTTAAVSAGADELTFNNTLLFGIAYPGTANTSGWLSAGNAGSNTSHLPAALSSGNNHIFLTGTTAIPAVNGGKYVGPRTGFSSPADYRAAIANNTNWEKVGSSGAVSYNTTTFELGAPPSITAQPTNKSICVSTGTTFSITANNTTSYQWEVNQGSGFTTVTNVGAYSGSTTNTLIITNASLVMSGYAYRCIATGTSSPVATSSQATLTVNPSPTITTNPADKLVCVGSMTSFNAAIANASSYVWQVNSGSGFNDIVNNGMYSGQGTTTLTITGATIPMNGYTYRLKGTGNCTPTATTNHATLSVNASPAIVTNPTNTTICAGSGAFFGISASNATAYQWEVNTGSGFSTLTNNGTYSGVNNTMLTISSVTVGMNNYTYRCVASSPCSPAATSSAATLSVLPLITYYRDADSDGYGNPSVTQTSCAGPPAGFVPNNTDCNDSNASINPGPIVFTQNPADSAICPTGNTSFQAASNADSYQWQVNTGSSFTNIENGGVYSGANTATLSITNATAGMNGYIYRNVGSKSCTTSVASGLGTLTINPSPAIVSNLTPVAICEGTGTVFSASITNASVFLWQFNSGSGYTDITNGGLYSGQGTNTLTITNAPLTMNNYTFRLIASGHCSPAAIAGPATLTVNAAPIILSGPDNAGTCENGNAVFSVATANGSAYQWQADTGAGFINLDNNTTYSGAMGAELSISAATGSMNGYLYRCIVSGNCSPSATSTPAMLTVVPLVTYYRDADTDGYGNPSITLASCSGAPAGYVGNSLDCNDSNAADNPAPIAFSLQPANTSTCEFSNTSFQVDANATSYQWQLDAGDGFIDISEDGTHSGADSNVLSIFFATSDLNGYIYRCVAIKSCTTNVISNNAVLTITAPPAINTNITPATVCAGGTASFSSEVDNAVSYTWQMSTGGAFTSVPNNGLYAGLGTDTLSIVGATAAMNGYRYRMIATGNCTPSVVLGPVILTVNTAPAISSHPLDKTVCEGSDTVFSSQATAVTGYQWQVNDGSGYADISNEAPYSGTNTSTLTISAIPLSLDGNLYRCVAAGNCDPTAASLAATLYVDAATVYFEDADGDGYGNFSVTVSACAEIPEGFVANSLDCNDSAASIYPGAIEIYGNNIDDNCNSEVDTDAADCSFTTTWNGAGWSPFPPVANQKAIIAGTYLAETDLVACSLEIINDAAVVVASGNDLIIHDAVKVTSGSLTFENNANLLQDPNAESNNNLGNITYQRQASVRRLDYVFWASPVLTQNLQLFSPLTLSNRFYTLDEDTNAFELINPAQNSFVTAKGYMIRAPNTFIDAPAASQVYTGNFYGTPNNGDISIPLSANGNGYNLIGNPYPSPISADLFLDQNPGTIYFWSTANTGPTAGSYAAFNTLGAVASSATGEIPNGYIQAGQGFLLNKGVAGVAVFDNGMRTGNNDNQFFRTGTNNERHRIWLNLSKDNVLVNQILIGYTEGATNSADTSIDGKMFPGGASISSTINGEQYQIQGRSLPFEAADLVMLHLKCESAGQYAISIDHLDGLFTGEQDIYIRDNLFGTTHNIKTEPYHFMSDQGNFGDRFSIVYQNAVLGTDTSPSVSGSVIIYKSDHVLHLNSGSVETKSVKIFDIRGRLLFENDRVNASNCTARLNIAQQMLIVHAITADGQMTIKKVMF